MKKKNPSYESILKEFYINESKFQELKKWLENSSLSDYKPSKSSILEKGREKLANFVFSKE